MADCLIEKRDDGVALITLNRPEALNAVSSELQALLGAFLVECEADASVRCVAVTGAGRGFVLAVMSNNSRVIMTPLRRMWRTIPKRALPQGQHALTPI